jgi:hypothetical protein
MTEINQTGHYCPNAQRTDGRPLNGIMVCTTAGKKGKPRQNIIITNTKNAHLFTRQTETKTGWPACRPRCESFGQSLAEDGGGGGLDGSGILLKEKKVP